MKSTEAIETKRFWIIAQKPKGIDSEIVYNVSGALSIKIEKATPLVRYQYEVYVGTKHISEVRGTIFATGSRSAHVDLVIRQGLNPDSISVKIVDPTKQPSRS